jgi:hypothetical protein
MSISLPLFRSVFASFIFLTLLGGGASAQEAELITDRPDQTESAAVVGPGLVQVETGFQLSRSDDPDSRVETQELLATLVRIGLHERLELRLGWAGWIRTETEARGPAGERSEADGAGDTELGFKVRFFEESGGRPAVALLAATSVPSGAAEFSTDRADPSFRLSVAHTLSERVSLGYNVGAAWETAQTDRGPTTLSRALYTVAAGFSLSDRVGAFVELYGDLGGSAGGGPAHSADGGLTFLIRDNLQLDLAGGVGLTDLADDWFVGLGLSVRIPR